MVQVVEVCCTAIGWNKAQQFLCLPMLLKGCAQATFEALDEKHTGTCASL